jgi:anti-anti-sigma factor
MPDIRFLVEMVKGVPVVAAPEEIDITNAGELRRSLLESAAYGSGTLVVDLTRTQFCDTSGLHALVGARKRAQATAATCCSSHPAPGSCASSPSQGSTRCFPASPPWTKRSRTYPVALAGYPATVHGPYGRPRFRDGATLPPDACGRDIAPVPAGHPENFRAPAGGLPGPGAVIWRLRNGVNALFATDMAWPGFT